MNEAQARRPPASFGDARLQPSRSDRDHRVAAADSGLRGLPRDRLALGASAHVPDLRQDRLLRLITEPARPQARGRRRSSARPFRRAGRGLELLLRRRRRVRARRGAPLSHTLPELPLHEWRQTKDTLHLWAQIVGKVKLASTPPENHWWNVPLYVDV